MCFITNISIFRHYFQSLPYTQTVRSPSRQAIPGRYPGTPARFPSHLRYNSTVFPLFLYNLIFNSIYLLLSLFSSVHFFSIKKCSHHKIYAAAATFLVHMILLSVSCQQGDSANSRQDTHDHKYIHAFCVSSGHRHGKHC